LEIRQPKRKLKIAFILAPTNEIRPPVYLSGVAVSVDLMIDEITRRLAGSHDVIVYCWRGEGQQKVEKFDGVEYRRMSNPLDRWFLSHPNKIMRLINLVCWRKSPQPLFNSKLWYREYIGKVGADLSRQNCDIVHIMNLSQFVPIIRGQRRGSCCIWQLNG
jgi:hypothetical protein